MYITETRYWTPDTELLPCTRQPRLPQPLPDVNPARMQGKDFAGLRRPGLLQFPGRRAGASRMRSGVGDVVAQLANVLPRLWYHRRLREAMMLHGTRRASTCRPFTLFECGLDRQPSRGRILVTVIGGQGIQRWAARGKFGQVGG
jgi:hypothetical protein